MQAGDKVEDFTLQNQDGVIHVKARRIARLNITSAQVRSHDFH